MKKFKQSSPNEEINLFTVVKRCFLFTIIFFMFSLLLLLVLSFLFMKSKDPASWINLIGKFTLYFSAFVCSFILSKKNKQNYILSGLILGAIITGVIFTISLFYKNDANNSTIWLALIPVTTILGSVVAIKRRSKPRKRHRK